MAKSRFAWPDPFFGVNFTDRGRNDATAEIRRVTGLCFSLDHMAANSMRAFSNKYGVPYNHVHMSDALVFCCMELGIDYEQFEHNAQKLSIEGFVVRATTHLTVGFDTIADNETRRFVQRTVLQKLFRDWVSEQGRQQRDYEDPSWDDIAANVVKQRNKKRKRRKSNASPPKLQLVSSRD